LGALDQQRTQVGVATLADAQQVLFTTAGMLLGHQAQPGRNLSAILEVSGISQRSGQSAGGDRADAGYVFESFAGWIATVPGENLGFELPDLRLQRLEVIEQPIHQDKEAAWQIAAGILDQGGYAFGDVRYALRNDQAELRQQAPDLIGLCCACTNKTLADPVHRQHRLLLHVLDGHKTHGGASYSLADGLGICGNMLVAFDVGLHELRRHQPNRVPHALELARPVMCAAAGFHAHQYRRQVREEGCHPLTLKGLVEKLLAMGIHPVDLKDVLGQINPDGRRLHGGLLLVNED